MEINTFTQLSVIGPKGNLRSYIPQDNVFLRGVLNFSSTTREENYVKCKPGEYVLLTGGSDRIYCSLNKEGEGTIICPDNYNFYLDEKGMLIMEI